jgi:serine protease SohB
MHVVTATLQIIIDGILICLLLLGVFIAITLVFLIIKLLRNQGALGGKHGLLQMHAKTKFDKQEAIATRLVKERKKLLKLDSSSTAVAVTDEAKAVVASVIRPVVAVRFDGDLFASERKGFAQMVDEILVNRERVDSVVVVVSSPGGSVSHYGQMFSEMERIRESGLNLTVCVDTTAASGGYLMSLPAHKIVAAPYAMVGSIGVVSEFVNGYEFLKERGIEPITMTAGKYKRSVTPIGQITEEGKQHFQERLEAIHRLFIVSVKKYRDVDADRVCNGDYWTAQESVDLNLGLVDELGTSQDYLFKLNQANDLVMISQKKSKLDQGLMRVSMQLLDAIMSRLGLSEMARP